MPFTKHASFEDAQIIDIKGAPTREHTASLDKLSDFANYRTSDGFLYARIRAISSRINKNWDGWPSVELAGSPELFERHHSGPGFTVEANDGNEEFGFATFVGKPIFVDHHNSDPKKARGVIRDAKLRVLDQRTATVKDSYWGGHDVDHEHMPPTEIELLLEVDAKTFPHLARDIVNGDLDGFSMGCNVQKTKCSHCGNIAESPEQFCAHVISKGAHHDFKTADGKRISKKSYENCYGLQFFEISAVFDPADPTALAREVISRKQSVLETGHPVSLDQTYRDPVRNDAEIADLAMSYQLRGVDYQTAIDMAQQQWEKENGMPVNGEGEGYAPKAWDYMQNADLHGMPLNPNGQSFTGPPQRTEVPAGPFGQAAEDALNEKFPNRPRMNNPLYSKTAMTKTAENPLPQEFLVRAPDEIDTLRDEQVCPICGADMEGESCEICGYVKPPKDFDNPDLNKAVEIRQRMKEEEEQQAQGQQQPQGGPLTSQMPNKSPAIASLKSDMRWTPNVHPKTAARINQVERPVSTSSKPTSNEPSNETVLSDQHAPVTSAMMTARQLIANANQKGKNMNTRTADGPTPPGDTASDARVDVTGVGGVLDSSNDTASKADAQVDVVGKGSTGVSDVSADKTETLPTAGRESDDAGFNKDKTTEDSGPTSTFGDSDGTQKGITDPVTDETLEEQDQQGGSKGPVRETHRVAYDDNTLEQGEQQGNQPVAQGGSAVQGVQPIDPVATDSYKRVNVLEHTTSPSNNSGPTTTWSGTDGNGVLRQQEPVTKNLPETGGVPTPDVKASKAHMITALRLAEMEQELGLLTREDKWDRVAALDEQSSDQLKAQIETLARVKTAGLAKLAQKRESGVTRLPSFKRIATGEEPKEASTVSDESLDAGLFLR